jgi:hypothetical protein
MELSKEQLLQIHNYIFVCGIKYYDVRVEIVDHFAIILERKLDENPDLNLKQEIINMHKNFSDKGFSKLLKEKKNSVTKRFFKQTLQQLRTFFKLPKIIITVCMFFVLYNIQFFFEDIENYFQILFCTTAILMPVIFWSAKKRNKKEQFLALSLSLGFLQVYHLLVICMQFSYSRSLESLSNATHNNIFIGSYVVVFLFFFAGESVYHQHKKVVKKQYPNIVV